MCHAEAVTALPHTHTMHMWHAAIAPHSVTSQIMELQDLWVTPSCPIRSWNRKKGLSWHLQPYFSFWLGGSSWMCLWLLQTDRSWKSWACSGMFLRLKVWVCVCVHVYVRVNDFVCVSACNCVSMHVCLCAMWNSGPGVAKLGPKQSAG